MHVEHRGICTHLGDDHLSRLTEAVATVEALVLGGRVPCLKHIRTIYETGTSQIQQRHMNKPWKQIYWYLYTDIENKSTDISDITGEQQKLLQKKMNADKFEKQLKL